MWNVIKSQIYQLKKDRLVWVVFAALLFLEYTSMTGEMDYSNLDEACLYVAGNASNVVFMCMLFLGILVGRIGGGDFADKTVNYELMSGHTRKEIYFGRAVLCLVFGILLVLLISAFPIVAAVLQYGWGSGLSLSGVIIRWLLLCFPIFRIICELLMINFIFKNPYITMACGFFFYTVGEMLTELLAAHETNLLGIFTIKKLCSFESWSSYRIADSRELTRYEAALSAGDAAAIILQSLWWGMVMLMVGYLFFKKDDIN
jgi:ABC-type transport system involved in multi-copper enzyme maturation permease subunit